MSEIQLVCLCVMLFAFQNEVFKFEREHTNIFALVA